MSHVAFIDKNKIKQMIYLNVKKNWNHNQIASCWTTFILIKTDIALKIIFNMLSEFSSPFIPILHWLWFSCNFSQWRKKSMSNSIYFVAIFFIILTWTMQFIWNALFQTLENEMVDFIAKNNNANQIYICEWNGI